MQRVKMAGLTSFLLVCLVVVNAQDSTRKKISLPDIPGYVTLRCDFHMHTVFSDGHVWPTFRVNEAVRDELDAISLTEHIDFEGQPDDIKRNYNRSFDLATEAAKNKNLLVIRGAEISPRVPPYHNNALFLKDANVIPSPYMKDWKKKFVMKDSIKHDELMAPFLEVKKQDAFVFYNHPGYSWWDKKDTSIFTSFHKELLEKGILAGVEVANSGKYNIIAHRLAMQYNLTMVSNTDEHYDMFARYYETHRPMTLVFAKTKSEAAIKEALKARRTAVFIDNYIIARQPEAEAFFKSSIQLSVKKQLRNGEPILVVDLLNKSSVPYQIRATAQYNIEEFPLGQTTLQPNVKTTIILKAIWKYPKEIPLGIEVFNIIVSPEESLKTEFNLVIPQS
ncbi:Sb-PDE family phosphodiesterase [Flavitalea sp.]|nr:Sb-PDE family phosphodiesterase [Flavitalea sp.]